MSELDAFLDAFAGWAGGDGLEPVDALTALAVGLEQASEMPATPPACGPPIGFDLRTVTIELPFAVPAAIASPDLLGRAH